MYHLVFFVPKLNKNEKNKSLGLKRQIKQIKYVRLY